MSLKESFRSEVEVVVFIFEFLSVFPNVSSISHDCWVRERKVDLAEVFDSFHGILFELSVSHQVELSFLKKSNYADRQGSVNSKIDMWDILFLEFKKRLIRDIAFGITLWQINDSTHFELLETVQIHFRRGFVLKFQSARCG